MSSLAENYHLSTHDVLALYEYFHRLKFIKETKHEAATHTIQELFAYWNRARIPVRDERKAIKKLKDLLTAWKKLKKNKNKRNETHKINKEVFSAEFLNLFDVSHGNAFQMITIQKDRDFLLAQWEFGRGCMVGLDRKLKKKEDEKTTQIEQIKKRKLIVKKTKQSCLKKLC